MEPEVEKRPEIFLPSPPAYLTRFYGGIDYGREVFQKKAITFIHVSLMNDPFDPYFEFINDFSDSYGAIIKWIRNTHGTKSARCFKRGVSYNDWDNAVKDIKQKNKNYRSNSFLFCTSAPLGDTDPYRNLYMWGHYCAGHRGIAIEFDAERVASSVVEHQKQINPEWSKEAKVWTPVIYGDKIDKLTPADFYEFMTTRAGEELATNLAVHFNTVSRIKSTVWRPEQEWRLMWHNDEVNSTIYRVPILPGSVHRVFIGLRVPDEIASQIAADCRAAFPEAEVLKGEARPGEFALDFRPI